MINELQAVYDKKISIERIAASITSRFPNSELKNIRSADFGLWKVSEKKIVIQLSVFKGEDISIDKGDRLLILTKMSEGKEK